MTDEITIDGMPFIAARSAAAIVGMSPDYLTRWCREGLVHARRLAGGVWFVNFASLKQRIAQREARKAEWRAQLAQQRREEHDAALRTA